MKTSFETRVSLLLLWLGSFEARFSHSLLWLGSSKTRVSLFAIVVRQF